MEGSGLLSEGRPGRHVLAGSGAGCVPLRCLGLELAMV